MTIQKKSLISTLKTTKKANAASSAASPEATHVMSKKNTKFMSKNLSKMRNLRAPANSRA
jgi:hypothetical protein